jgi:cholesterol oxidase
MTATTELWFHEQMTGFFAWGETDPRTGEQVAKRTRSWFGFDLEIHVDDLDAFLADRSNAARVTGHYLGDLLKGPAVSIDTGAFRFMSPGPADTRLMEHRHEFTYDQKKYTFVGTKYLDDDPLAVDMVQDLTTLYSQILDENGAVVAAGVLHFPMKNFPKLVASFDTRGPGAGFGAKMRFLRMFVREELHVLLEGFAQPPAPPTRRRTLSRSHAQLAAVYDVLVVGSGYGAGAVASRLAGWRDAAGGRKRVAMLERGKEWIAGEFPDQPWEMPNALKHSLNPSGLFEFHFAGDVDVLVGSGLGGTSLINANVMIEPEPWVFSTPVWPKKLPALTPYFQRANAMLRPAYDPQPPLKSNVFLGAADSAPGCTSKSLLPLAVTFVKTDRTQDTGNVQDACVRCGGCVTGCNFTAKSTVDQNYLSVAERQGLEVYTNIEVLTVARTAAGVAVTVKDHELDREMVIEAKQVVLGAGALGSFSILARSQAAGLAVSPALGASFSGNGDVLGFGYNTDHKTDQSVGTTITSIAHFRGDPDKSKHFIIEEGGVPEALTAVLRSLLPIVKLYGRDTDRGWADGVREWLREKADVFGWQSKGALESSLIYLGMGFEERLGTLRLEGGRVRVEWPGAASLPFAARVDSAMLALTTALGGTYIQNPEPRHFITRDLMTVHPLGGCVMGDDPATSVVNGLGEVHGHEGAIYVADGSIVPAPLGVNPALTIAALGEFIGESITNGW